MKKTFVFSNLATTLDGKIATAGREFFQLGSQSDIKLLRRLRNKADSVLMGAETLRTWRKPCHPEKNKKIINAILSRNLKGINPDWPFFKSTRIERILFVTESVSKLRQSEFLKNSEIVFLDKNKSIASQIIQAHRARGLNNILVEGGGGLMSEFVQENRINKYYVTLTPRILGGVSAPTLVDGGGLTPKQVVNLKLEKIERVGSELFLVYSALKKRGKKHPLLKT